MSKEEGEEAFEEVSTEDLLPKILVREPVTHDTWEHGKFTTYQIVVKTDHPAFHLPLSVVRRRYSEVRWLYNTLKQNHKHMSLPAPPPKRVMSERFNNDFINMRMQGLQDFLNELLIIDTVLSDSAFHLFLQTDLTTEEMDEYFAGILSEEIIEAAWKNAGHIHTSSFCINSAALLYEPQEIVMNEEDVPFVAMAADDSNFNSRSSLSEDNVAAQVGGASGPASAADGNATSEDDFPPRYQVVSPVPSTDSVSSMTPLGGQGVIEMRAPVKNK